MAIQNIVKVEERENEESEDISGILDSLKSLQLQPGNEEDEDSEEKHGPSVQKTYDSCFEKLEEEKYTEQKKEIDSETGDCTLCTATEKENASVAEQPSKIQEVLKGEKDETLPNILEKEIEYKTEKGAKEFKPDVMNDAEESDDENESDEEESDNGNSTQPLVAAQKKAINKQGPLTRGLGMQTMSSYIDQSTYRSNGQLTLANSYTPEPIKEQVGSRGYMPYETPPNDSFSGYQLNCETDVLECQMDGSPYQSYMCNTSEESFLQSPMMNRSGGYQSGLGSPEMGLNQDFYLPDSPNSSHTDENEFTQIPYPSMQIPSPYNGRFADTDEVSEVFAAIDRVEKKPHTRVPVEELFDITQELQSCEAISFRMSDASLNSHEINRISPSFTYDNNRILAYYRNLYSSLEAEKLIKNKLNKRKYMNLFKLMATMPNESILKKDKDGDTPIMIIVCNSNTNEDGNEQIVAAFERVRSINICCEVPVDKVKKRCSVCLNSDDSTFYSPLAMKSLSQDTILSAVLKLNYPELIVNYICEILMKRSADILKVFDEKSVPFYQNREDDYPVIKELMHLSYQMRNSVSFEPWRSN